MNPIRATMPSFPIPRWFLITALIVGGLYFVQGKRKQAVGEFSNPIAALLDDRLHPAANDFEGRRTRFVKVLATLEDARKNNILPEEVMAQAYEKLPINEEIGRLLTQTAVENLETARRMGLLDSENLARLREGVLPRIATGAFAGDEVDFEYAIPIEIAPELETQFANLELRPDFLSREMGSPVNPASLAKADGFYRANLISQGSYLRVGAQFE